MGLLNWIKKFLQPQESMIRVNCQTMPLAQWDAMRRRRGSNPPAPGSKPAAPSGPPPNPSCGGGEITRAQWEAMRTPFTESAVQRGNGNGGPVTPKPPIKPQPTGGRLIYGDRDPGPVPPRLPGDLAGLPVLTAEVPSDQQMKRWKRAALAEHLNDGEPTWRTAALLAFAEGRRQAQSLRIPPPGAEPVATDEDLWEMWALPGGYYDSRRAIYDLGRADERTAILRALGVEP